MRRFSLALSVLLLLPILPLAHADPGGVDAPQGRDERTDVPVGTFEGNLSWTAGDARDRYRALHGEGKGARVTVWSDDARFFVESPDFNPYMDSGNAAPRPAPNGTGYQSTRILAGDGGADFSVTLEPYVAWLAYVVTIEAMDIADLEIVSLRVTTRGGGLETCSVGWCFEEQTVDVEMTVRAIGALPYRGTLIISAGGNSVILAGADVTLEPGTTLTLHARWMPVGVGDVDIEGRATWEADRNPFNNVLREQCTLYAGGFRGAAVV